MAQILSYKDSFKEIEKIGVNVIFGAILPYADYTFGIPTYKRSKDLEKAIESIYSQKTDIPFNVIVVDNNSERNDETECLLLDKYSSKSNFQYLKNNENIGMAGNWNRLFLQCQSKYLIMLHDDDYLYDFFLSYMDMLVHSIPDFSVINSRKKKWNGRDAVHQYSPLGQVTYIEHSAYTNLLNYEFYAPSGCLFNMENIINAGGFDSQTYPSIDYVFILKLLLNKKKCITTTDELMLYRCVDNATSKKKTVLLWIDFEYKLKRELTEFLNLNLFIRKLVVAYTTKYWLNTLHRQFGEKIIYKKISAPSRPCMAFIRLIRYLVQTIFINRLHKKSTQRMLRPNNEYFK